MATSKYSNLMPRPGANLIKLFWQKFTHVFCKLDCCTNVAIFFSVMKKFSFQKSINRFRPIKFYEIDSTGVDLIKHFWINLLALFCKLVHFIAMQQNCLFIKWPSLLKSRSKFTPKKFYEIDPYFCCKDRPA